jgi:hypothetical protein
MSTNNDKNGGDTPSDGGDITSTTSKIPPPPAKYLHQESQELTLILRKVEISEVVEMVEIFSVYLGRMRLKF